MTVAGLLLCLALGDEVPLAPYSAGEESPVAHEGGKRSAYSPRAWADTTLPQVTPAMTLVEGNILGIEGFVYPEPGSSLSNLGAFRVEGMARQGKLRKPSTALRAVLDYGGGTEVHLNRVCPGVLVRTEASRIELFVRCAVAGEGWRVTGKGSRPPLWVAFSEGGRVRVAEAKGEVPLGKMEEPWLLAWWGGQGGFEIPLRPADGGPSRNIWPVYPAASDLRVGKGIGEWPMLVVLERRAERLAADGDGWSLSFGGPAGRTIVAPLYGRRWVRREEIARWKDGVPAAAAAQARAWTARLRAVPVDVREEMGLEQGVPTVTDRFTVEEIRDAWGTKPRPWAPLPPVFALAWKEGFPVRPADGGPFEDWGWLHRLGPLGGLDGRREISFRISIPQLESYLADEPKARPGGGDAARRLREKLAAEVDRVLAAGPLAPHQWPFGEMGSGLYFSTYFHNPGETLVTLAWALPHLDDARAAKLRAYLRGEFRDSSPFEERWWGDLKGRRGAARERYPLDAQYPRWIGGTTFSLHNLYAAWLYSEAAAEKGEVPGIWARSKEYLEAHLRRAPVEWDYTERVRFPVRHDWGRHFTFLTHRDHPAAESRYESFNSRLSGLIGYVRLARTAGDAAAAERGTCWLARHLALRYAQLHFDRYLVGLGVHDPEPSLGGRAPSATLLRGHYIGPWLIWTYVWKENKPEGDTHEGDRIYLMHVNHPVWSGGPSGAGVASGREQVLDASVVYAGLDLVPGTGRFYRDYAREFVETAFRRFETLAPTWWMADGPAYFDSEESVAAPEIAWAGFLAAALVLEREGAALSRWVDFPQAKTGDLYYLQKLALAARALPSSR